MIVAVDTSVWVAALRDGASKEAEALRKLLDGDAAALPIPVRLELLGGASRPDSARLRRILSALPVLFPGAATWERIDGWIEHATRVGQRFGFADMLIAALAVDAEAAVWSLDRDFARLERLGLVRRFQP